MKPHYTTEKLLLDLLTEDDHAFILKLVNTSGWLQYIGDRNIHSAKDALEYINKIKNTPQLFYWVVRKKDTEIPMGIISFLKRSYLDHFDIGFAFLPEHQGRGFAFEAAGKILYEAYKTGDYSPILATTFPENTSSVKLLTKLGFVFEKEIAAEVGNLQVYSNAACKIKRV